jgi:hypothetical protein
MATKFSRAAPSSRYRRLVEQYQLMHLQGETHLGIPPEQTFPGESLPKEAARIKRLIKLTGARTILDYGAGALSGGRRAVDPGRALRLRQ